MTVRSQHLKIAGALGAAALTVGALTTPALAANHDLTYGCDLPLGPTDATLNPGSIPAKMAVGEVSKRTITLVVHLNAVQTGTAANFGTSVSGSIVSTGGTLPFNLKIPATPIPQTPGDTMDASASGKGSVTATKVGSVKINAGDITATLNLTGGAGGPQTLPQNCTAPTDGTQTLGTVTVSKDKTKSKVSSKVSGKKATATDKIKSHFGVKPTGKVSFTFKKGSKTVKASGKINKKGVATASKTLTAGKWSVTAKYKGDKNLKGSTGKGTVTVK